MHAVQADADLSKHIQDSGTPPFYALSWLITWFAHNCPSLEKMTRAFDVLLAAHPMMPLYMCVSVIKVSVVDTFCAYFLPTAFQLIS